MKRFLTVLLCLILVLGCGSTALAAEDGKFSHLLRAHDWDADAFHDIDASAWYYESLVSAYRMGLVSGYGDGSFAPAANVTVAQAVKFAACINSLYRTADIAFEEGEPWYRCYVDYALEQGIIRQEFDSYNRPATRAEFASILYRALPRSYFPAINTVENGSISDVPYNLSYSGAVYTLYRAGVLTGSDGKGSFLPDSAITRAEAVAIMGRIMMENQRKTIQLAASEKAVLTSEEIFAVCSPAVFYIEMYDAKGEKTANGSGFFINSDGTAVTCWHVLEKGVSAKICTPEGEIYDMLGVYDYDMVNDWAVIQIDGDSFPYLEIADAKTNVGGATVYALGSPLGIQNTLTVGIISNPLRIEELTRFILISTPISQGSSGSPLITKYGDVIGIVAATYVYGQDLNLAINIDYLDNAARDKLTPLDEIIALLPAAEEEAEEETPAPEPSPIE